VSAVINILRGVPVEHGRALGRDAIVSVDPNLPVSACAGRIS
jgi:hypothetical protein